MRFQPTFNQTILILFFFVSNLSPLFAKKLQSLETNGIEFTSFSLDIIGNEGKLSWEIKNPAAGYHFEVWRSVDNFSYERTVETIEIASNTTTYKFSDYNLGSFDPLTVSYKIKIVGEDGFVLFSDVIRVMPKKKGGYPIYSVVGPNPTSDELQIHCKMEDLGGATLKIFSATGEEVYRNENVVGEGDVQVNLDVRSWAKGFYYINLMKNDYTITHKVFIK
jgi:hypothetical protein